MTEGAKLAERTDRPLTRFPHEQTKTRTSCIEAVRAASTTTRFVDGRGLLPQSSNIARIRGAP